MPSMRTLLVLLLLPASVAMAEDNPFISFNQRAFGQMKTWLLASAEKMPAESYSFKPTDAVRSFGQLVGHVADAQYYFCSTALGEKNPSPKVEETKTTKADLVGALKDAFSYCDKAYDSITAASLGQTVKFMGNDMPRPIVLEVNALHDAEHYGNMITYLRLKNIVPPSS